MAQVAIKISLSSSCWFGRHVQHLVPKFPNLCVVPSSMQSVCRRLSVAAEVALVHQIRSELNHPARYSCVRRDFDANTMLQCSFQSSGLTGTVWLSPLVVCLAQSGFFLDELVLAIQRNSGIAHVILCLLLRMTRIGVSCSSNSFSPRNPLSIDTWSTPSKSP